MSQELVNNLLKQVNYPGFSRDIVSFGLIQEAKLEGKKAFVKVEITSTDPTLPNTLKGEINRVLLNNDSIDEIQKKASEIMEQATLPYLDLDVPLKVEGGHGINWSLAH